jgi:hypothetical protein
MKTEPAVNWNTKDQAQILQIRDLLGQALEKTDSLEEKIPMQYLEHLNNETSDPATDAICSLIARIEDALDEILDFENATAEREA